MGHKRLSWLRKSQAWVEIIEEMGDYALGKSVMDSIAKKTLSNLQSQYSNFENDPSIKSTFEFLLHISQAFQRQDPLAYLKEKNIFDGETFSIIKLSQAAARYKEDEVASHEYATFAKQAVVEAISHWYKLNIEKGRSLFHEGIDTAAIFNKAGSSGGFCELARLYFSKITGRYLKYFLEREAAVAIPNIEYRDRFSNEIENHIDKISNHAFETSKITQSFAAGWFTNHAKNDYPEEQQIKYFLNRALGKMKSELLREEMK